MADIQFQEEVSASQNSFQAYSAEKPLFIRKLLAWGIVSTDEQARYVLIGTTVMATLLALYLAIHSAQPSGRTFSPEEIQNFQQMSQQVGR